MLCEWKSRYVNYVSERFNSPLICPLNWFLKTFFWFSEDILGFGWLKLCLGHCCWQSPRISFLFLGTSFRLFCFFCDGIEGGIGERCCLNEKFLVSGWFGFCLRIESSLSSCWTSGYKFFLLCLWVLFSWCSRCYFS